MGGVGVGSGGEEMKTIVLEQQLKVKKKKKIHINLIHKENP